MIDPTPQASAEIHARYERAVASLLGKVEQDPYVLAVVLYGSLSNDVVWEKSDIDLVIVTQENRAKTPSFTLTEEGINIHACLMTRSEFVRRLEGSIQSSFVHSMMMKGQLLYTCDQSLERLWENRRHFGMRDREVRLLQACVTLTMTLTKAQKWLYVKCDPHYSAHWIFKSLDALATIETVMAGEIAGREVLWQAMQHNPGFYQSVYIGLMDGPKTPEAVGAVLAQIDAYLRERTPVIFRPILDYLAEAGGVRSAREIDHHFNNQMNLEHAALLCEWLADEGLIRRAALPARLTEKSRVDVEEVAYYDERE